MFNALMWGSAAAAAMTMGLVAYAEEESKETQEQAAETQAVVEEKAEEGEKEEESVMEVLKPEMIKEVMNNKENKLIYFYHGAAPNKAELQRVEEHAHKMYNGMRVKPYLLDIDQH